MLFRSCIVVEEGGDDWNDFVIRTGRGSFIKLIDCTAASTTDTGVTKVPIIQGGYDYRPGPDGSRGANGRIYGDRCQTLVERVNGTWDQPYNPGDVITLETGDRVSFPAEFEVEIGNATLPPELTRLGATIVRINPPLATVPYRSMVGFNVGKRNVPPGIKSMVGFDDSPGAATKPNQFGYENDYPAARAQGFSDADIRYYLQNVYKGKIGPLMQQKLNDPNWGRISDARTVATTVSWFSMEDYQEAKRQGYTDSDIRFFLETNYIGRISPKVQSLLNDPNFGRKASNVPAGYYGIKQMFGFDDSAGTSNAFGYERDYQEARRRGFSDADIRYYLENH